MLINSLQVIHVAKKLKLEAAETSKKKDSHKLPEVDLSVLPPLSKELQKFVEEKGAVKADTKLINFYSQYLWQQVGSHPSKYQYSTFSSAIVSTYPVLKGGSNGKVWIHESFIFIF